MEPRPERSRRQVILFLSSCALVIFIIIGIILLLLHQNDSPKHRTTYRKISAPGSVLRVIGFRVSDHEIVIDLTALDKVERNELRGRKLTIHCLDQKVNTLIPASREDSEIRIGFKEHISLDDPITCHGSISGNPQHVDSVLKALDEIPL